MKCFSFTNFLFLATTVYVAHSMWTLYSLWTPQKCDPNLHKFCLKSAIHQKPEQKWKLKLYTSPKKTDFSADKATLLKTYKKFDFNTDFKEKLDIKLPQSTINNGSLYLHLFLYPQGESMTSRTSMKRVFPLTKHALPVYYFNLLKGLTSSSNNDTDEDVSLETGKSPVTHYHPSIKMHVMNEDIQFPQRDFPSELIQFAVLDSDRNYLPILYLDDLSQLERNLQILPSNSSEIKVSFSYEPISTGKLRFYMLFRQSIGLLKENGFSDKDTDDIKSLLTETKLHFLAMTFVVTMFHALFDFLAFKNDIKYWKGRETMQGLSFNTVMFKCASSVIIFLYLCDQKASLLVTIPQGVGMLIEAWKVKKVLKVHVVWNGVIPSFERKEQVCEEEATRVHDQQAFKYLSYALYPLCLLGAVYSLFYVPHKSIYSWVVQSLVNGVYVFGFLFMLPQLFINYKLKSVAHLPWRAFTYKAFNTFIDDVFAFIIKMPTSHRIACFRDDIVFFCFLYQLWLYPVDKTRPNEYGYSYEEDEDKKKKED